MSSDHEIKFGKLQGDIMACPFFILVAEHYRADGSCRCNDPEHRKMMIEQWGYSEEDFS